MKGLFNAIKMHILKLIQPISGLCLLTQAIYLCQPEAIPEYDYIEPVYAEW